MKKVSRMPKKIVPIDEGVPLSEFTAKVVILSDQLFNYASHQSKQDVAVALSATVNVLARLLMISSPDPIQNFPQYVPWMEEMIAKTVEYYSGGDAPSRKWTVS